MFAGPLKVFDCQKNSNHDVGCCVTNAIDVATYVPGRTYALDVISPGHLTFGVDKGSLGGTRHHSRACGLQLRAHAHACAGILIS